MLLNEGIRAEQVGTCYLCGTGGLLLYQGIRDRLLDNSGSWSFFQCPKCQFVWLNPRPTPADTHKVYSEYFTRLNVNPQIPPLSSFRRKIKLSLINSYFSYDGPPHGLFYSLVGKLAGMFPHLREIAGSSVMYLHGSRKGKLLDIGCGSGVFLAAMRSLGWEVKGLELDEEPIKIARNRFGLEVVQGTIAEARFPDNSFDAITINHVIEHVYEPISLLSECWRVMKPNGKLVVITPNIESMGHRYFRESWFPLDPPRHLYLFSMRTLKTCAELAGFSTSVLRTRTSSAPGMYLASQTIKATGNLPSETLTNLCGPLYFKGKVFGLIERAMCLLLKNLGEEIIMVAEK